jgi:hypothetical protein
MKTSELTGAALDWAVAKCGGRGIEFDDPRDPWLTRDGIADQPLHSYTPSTDWAQGGPIIEREGITVSKDDGGWAAYFRENLFEDDGSEFWRNGPTPLIAAMRCYSASKLGDDVTLPLELEQTA